MTSKFTAAIKSVWKPVPPPPEPVQDMCDWEHIPTKDEVVRLMRCKVWYPTPEDTETGHDDDCTNQELDADQRDEIKAYIRQLIWEDHHAFEWNTPAEGMERQGESTIRTAYFEYKQRSIDLAVSFWESLAQKLSDDEWDEMWERMYCGVRYEINWLLYLETLQPRAPVVSEPDDGLKQLAEAAETLSPVPTASEAQPASATAVQDTSAPVETAADSSSSWKYIPYVW